MKTLFLITTAVAVSADSLICGFSLYAKRKLPVAAGISAVVLFMCLITYFFGNALKSVLTEKNANLGGVILIFIGIFNLFFTKKTPENCGSFLRRIFLVGFAVGIDGAAANLSLCITGYGYFYLPFLIAFTHFLAVSAGMFLADVKFIKAIAKTNCIAPIILIVSGLYKVLRFFI